MDTTPSTNDSSALDNTNLSSALSDWRNTLTLFRAHYNRLSTHINGSYKGLPLTTPRPGLAKLLAAMQGELVVLLREMDQLSPASTPQQEAQRLRAHTTRLAVLNQQASQLVALGNN
jgi:hypothetical protein